MVSIVTGGLAAVRQCRAFKTSKKCRATLTKLLPFDLGRGMNTARHAAVRTPEGDPRLGPFEADQPAFETCRQVSGTVHVPGERLVTVAAVPEVGAEISRSGANWLTRTMGRIRS